MLAQNFMTAADLGLDDKQYAALVGVLGMLERGEVLWSDYRERQDKGLRFNMSDFEYGHRCGTVCCIGGLADHVFHTDLGDRAVMMADGNPLSQLFFVEDESGDNIHALYDIKTEQAAQALRNYLTTGAPKWAEVLA